MEGCNGPNNICKKKPKDFTFGGQIYVFESNINLENNAYIAVYQSMPYSNLNKTLKRKVKCLKIRGYVAERCLFLMVS